LFKTLKYNAGFPDKPFATLAEARQWVSGFEHWYNEEHRHSAIQFVTLGQRNRGEDLLILKKREELYEAAKAKRPERWAKQSRNWNHSAAVTLNSKKIDQSSERTGKNSCMIWNHYNQFILFSILVL